MNLHNPATALERQGPASRLANVNLSNLLSGQFDAHRLVSIFRRHLRLFLAIAAAVLLTVVFVTLQTTPKYTATADVMLDVRKERVTNVQEVLSGLPADSSVVDTEVEVLKSRQLAERVVRQLKLEQDPEFNPAVHKRDGVGALIQGIGGLFGRATPSTPVLSAVQQEKQHERVVDNVLKRLGVKRAKLTYVINVSFTSESPTKAAEVANKFADLYLLEQLEAKFDATQQATQWLNSRLGDLRGQVLADEAAVQQYKIANNLLSASGTSLTEQEISNYNQTLAQARAQVAEDEARLNTAKQQMASGSSGDDVGEALSSPVIQKLREQRTEVSAKVADLQGRYGPRHPEMLKAKRELSDIDNQIQAEIQRIISNLQAKVQVSRERASAIAGSLGGAKGALAANNRATVGLDELERKAESSRTLYESYLNRYKETSTQQGVEQSDARVVSRAKIPIRQSSPKLLLNFSLGLLLALGAGLSGVGIAEVMDAGLATAEDVESRLGTSYLGAVPHLDSVVENSDQAPIDFVVAKPLSSFAESLRNLKASIQHSRLGEPVKVVALTSALPGEGKTTTSICLARVTAMQGLRTIIIDCDLRRRTLNRMLRADPSKGLLEVLAGEATLQQAIHVDEETGAHILPLAPSSFTPRDVFGTTAMDRLIAELRTRYDMVILDTAPVLPVADTRVLGPKCDAVVFLARWRKTPQQAIEAAFRLLGGTDSPVVGVALTQVDMKQQSKYGYGDPGYYYAEYKKYYAA